jgi:hypothetical protein
MVLRTREREQPHGPGRAPYRRDSHEIPPKLADVSKPCGAGTSAVRKMKTHSPSNPERGAGPSSSEWLTQPKGTSRRWPDLVRNDEATGQNGQTTFYKSRSSYMHACGTLASPGKFIRPRGPAGLFRRSMEGVCGWGGSLVKLDE